jgi:flagellin
VASASGQQDSTSRAALNSEAQALVSEITRIADNTKYGSDVLLGGAFGVAFSAGGSTIDDATGVTNVAVSGAAAGATFTVSVNENGNASTMYIYSNGVGAGQTVTFSTPASGQTEALVFDKLGVTVTVDSTIADASDQTLVTTSASDPSFQVGVDATDTDISLTLADLSADGIGISTLDLSTASGAESAMSSIDTAINAVNTALGNIGAFQNRMDFASANLASVFENISSAESTIRDADMAKETTDFTKNQILVQAGVAVLAQANVVSQSALALLQ